MPKKISKGGVTRRKAKNPGLNKSLHPHSRWEFLDGDYYHKLNDEEKAIMSKFLDEYYGAALGKADEPETWKDDFHSTPEERKACWDRTNARNRDLHNRMNMYGLMNELTDKISDDSSFYIDSNNQEDNMIKLLDTKDVAYSVRTKNGSKRTKR